MKNKGFECPELQFRAEKNKNSPLFGRIILEIGNPSCWENLLFHLVYHEIEQPARSLHFLLHISIRKLFFRLCSSFAGWLLFAELGFTYTANGKRLNDGKTISIKEKNEVVFYSSVIATPFFSTAIAVRDIIGSITFE